LLVNQRGFIHRRARAALAAVGVAASASRSASCASKQSADNDIVVTAGKFAADGAREAAPPPAATTPMATMQAYRAAPKMAMDAFGGGYVRVAPHAGDM
jgi:hypothetical protein